MDLKMGVQNLGVPRPL